MTDDYEATIHLGLNRAVVTINTHEKELLDVLESAVRNAYMRYEDEKERKRTS